MRFGIVAMQIDALAPAGLSLEQAVAHVIGFDHARLLGDLSERGFKLIELGGDL